MNRKRIYRSRIRIPATAFAFAGSGILFCLLEILFKSDGSSGNIGAFIILLPVPAAFFLLSFLLFRKAKRNEQVRIAEITAYANQMADGDEQVMPNHPDFGDDSGEIHTTINYYNQTKADGWQQNRALYGPLLNTSKTRNIKGTQTGFYYQTDDYRKVLPGYIIGTILMIIISIVLLILVPIFGVFVSIFSIAWIVGMWKKAPVKKWKNQAKKLKDEE